MLRKLFPNLKRGTEADEVYVMGAGTDLKRLFEARDILEKNLEIDHSIIILKELTEIDEKIDHMLGRKRMIGA